MLVDDGFEVELLEAEALELDPHHELNQRFPISCAGEFWMTGGHRLFGAHLYSGSKGLLTFRGCFVLLEVMLAGGEVN